MKKAVTLFVTLILLLTACVGCSPSDGDVETTTTLGDKNTTTTTTTDSADGESTTTAESQQIVIDGPVGTTTTVSTKKNETTTKATIKTTIAGDVVKDQFNFNDDITIIAWWDMTPGGDSELEQLLEESRENVEKKYNCKLVFKVVAVDDIPTQLMAAAMANEQFGDIVLLRHTQAFPYLAKANMLKKLDNYINTAYKMYNQSTFSVATVDGSIYGYSLGRVNANSLIYYNKDLFKKNNWKTPQEYYAENAWTWDNFAKICAEVKSSGLWGSGMLDYGLIDCILPSFGGSLMSYQNGAYKSMCVSQPNIDALTFINKVTYVDKVCEPRPDNASWDYAIWEFCAGRYAMLLEGDSSLKKVYYNLDAEFGVVPLPRAASQSKHLNVIRDVNCYTMPKMVSDDRAAKVMTIMEDFYNPYNLEEDTIYETSPYVYDEESQVVLNTVQKNTYISSARGIKEFYSLLLPALVDGAKNVGGASQALQSVDSGWQKALNDSLNVYN